MSIDMKDWEIAALIIAIGWNAYLLYLSIRYSEKESETLMTTSSDLMNEAFTTPFDGKHWMAITDETGDTKVMWSRDNEDEVENARRTFKDMKKKGYTAFRVEGKKGEAGAQMDEFDPDAERIIFTKPQAGG